MSQATFCEHVTSSPSSANGAAEPAVQFQVVPRFPDFADIDNGALFSLSLSNNTASLTHSLHRFPAKFIPQVPGWVLRQFACPGSVVLDPFCGSGTTLVEALQHCNESVGIDCDPLAALISRAKTRPVSPRRIQNLAAQIERSWMAPARSLELPMPGLANFTHWFSEQAWGWLQSLRTTILELKCTKEEREFLLCVFSSIIRWVSNADDQTQKTYVSGTLRKRPPDVRDTFWKALERAVRGMEALARCRIDGSRAQVHVGDSTCMPLPGASVDVIITSPPYLDSVDYMYNFMLEYFWLGPLLGIETRQQFNQARRRVLGAKNPENKSNLRLPEGLDELIADAEVAPARLPAAREYCHKMASHFRWASELLKPDGRYVLVVGNSQSRKGFLPVHDCLIRLAADAGLAFEKAFAYRIRRHYMKFPRKGRGGIILMDWIVVLKKQPTAVAYPARLPLPPCRLGAEDVAH